VSDSLVFKSLHDEGELELTAVTGAPGKPAESFMALLRKDGLQANTRTLAFRVDALAQMFDELALARTGFPGQKNWTSLDTHLSITCNMNGQDFIMTVRLKDGAPPVGWTAEASLRLAAGTLKHVAADVRQFFGL